MRDQSLKPIPVEERPFNAETPLQVLGRTPTPTGSFFVRNHFDTPNLDANSWRLSLDGLVQRPMQLSLDDLKRRPAKTLSVTFECAGNGRTTLKPRVPGTPWGWGAVGTADFTGTPLVGLLDDAGVRTSTLELLFTGADRGEMEPGRVADYERSLPLDVARSPDVLLAWSMNAEPLTREHGAPVRLIVPRWYGVASVKWLTRITAIDHAFIGFYQRERYVYVQDPHVPDDTPLTAMRLRSLIATPGEGARLALGPIDVRGSAWSGEATVAKVEFSADGGKTWQATQLAPNASAYAAATWHTTWTPRERGAYTLVSRATDVRGQTQPLEAVWNVHGYGNNMGHRIAVMVE